MSLGKWYSFFDLKKSLVAIIVVLLLIVLNNRWQRLLTTELSDKREELSESLALLDSSSEIHEKAKEVEALKVMKQGQSELENWTDRIAPLVAEQKLILRQVRPLGMEERGKVKEEKLFLQVEGNIDSLLTLLHHLAAQETPIYVSRYNITSRAIGSGFVSVELVLSRLIL
ncbi:MAG: hypothetical protein HY582_03115 [Candidatus Omnitrophica bacterium]|nr:hypothetical protein [Candidatus Omnitrophota bacterium]